MKKSPLAPEIPATLPAIAGVRMAACEAGIRYQGRKDLMLASFSEDTRVAGTFTKSRTASAAVDWCRKQIGKGIARGLVVNSGNANAFTGMKGIAAVEATAQAAANDLGCKAEDIFIASTGVIGEPLDPDSFTHRLKDLSENLSEGDWLDATAAIMTTDTFPKLATRTVTLDGVEVTINGFAKGSGMIAPDMATMLGFFFTDAFVKTDILRQICCASVTQSFNSITVDSDTSTSDTVLLFATGAARERGMAEMSSLEDPRLASFQQAMNEIMLDLALQIVRDGEGASKLVKITVEGAENDGAAKVIAMAIANSPLVKTAIAGEDPNWGRIIMAVGKSGEQADRDLLKIWFGDILVAADGEIAPSYMEEDGAGYMKQQELEIRVGLGLSSGKAQVWTCDLTHDYISINADYRS